MELAESGTQGALRIGGAPIVVTGRAAEAGGGEAGPRGPQRLKVSSGLTIVRSEFAVRRLFGNRTIS